MPTLAAGWVPNPRRILWPFLLSALVVAGTWTPPGELRDAATRDPVSGMRLVYSDPHIWGAPWFDLLDALSILTLSQHWAVLGTVLLTHLGVRLWRLIRRHRPFRPIRELLLVVASIAGLLLVYATAILVPRPMAKLVVFDRNTLVLDVHAHTMYSHDGRPGFTPAWRREWSEKAGYHAAYITDHLSYRTWDDAFRGMRETMALNPRHAGGGFVALRGLELRSGGQHVNVLSMSPADSVWVKDGDHLVGAMRLASDGLPAVVVHTIPSDLRRVAGPADDSLPRATAIEINDGAPRGLEQALRDHDRIVRIADSLDLALVAASNHHGWGNTAVAWTLVHLPGWQRLTPDSLALAIEAKLRTERRRATRVVERRTPEIQKGPGLLLLGPLLLYELNATLSPSQRLSWICWIWGLFHLGPLATAWLRGRRMLREA
jgi:hypothetical protein